MRIAVTADLHLSRSDKEHPERLAALRDIFEQLVALEIGHLLIAGDLFDHDGQGYAGFESVARDFPAIQVDIIPGNHDPGLKPGHLALDHVTVHDSPIVLVRDERQFLLLPYTAGKDMGEVIAESAGDLEPGEWVLVGHGNYGGGLRSPHPLEKGIYMPLSRRDIEHARPGLVLLGHIHVATDTGLVHYPGSPCGLDISETGPRRFLVLDTASLQLESHTVRSEVIYMAEQFTLVPEQHAEEKLRSEIAARIASWNLNEHQRSRVCVRIDSRGYCENRERIRDLLVDAFSEFTWYDDGPRIDHLKIHSDPRLLAVADGVRKRLAQVDWPWGGDEPSRDDVLRQALELVYGQETGA